MKTAVIYFSLTGNTGKVAEILKEGDTELIKIRKRCSILSIVGLGCKINFDAGRFDLIVLGCPVWAGRAAKPFMKALKHMDFGGKQVNAYVTCGKDEGKAMKQLMHEVEKHGGHPGRSMIFNMSKELKEDEVRRLLSF